MAGVGPVLGIALDGVRGALRKFERAARTLSEPLPPVGDTVTTGGAAPPDWTGAVVDLRVQKYAVVANLKTLSTASELAEQSLAIGKRR